MKNPLSYKARLLAALFLASFAIACLGWVAVPEIWREIQRTHDPDAFLIRDRGPVAGAIASYRLNHGSWPTSRAEIEPLLEPRQHWLRWTLELVDPNYGLYRGDYRAKHRVTTKHRQIILISNAGPIAKTRGQLAVPPSLELRTLIVRVPMQSGQ